MSDLKRIRLFAGIELPPKIRKACAAVADRLRGSGLDARFEAPGKLHITVAFLGWVEPERIASINEALERAAQNSSSFALTLDKLGAFPHERRPRVIWIGAREQGAPFRELSRAVRKEFESLGFSFEKDSVAHVTIARVKGGPAHLPVLDLAPMKLAVRSVTLFESIPAGRTTRYEVRSRHGLRRAANRPSE